MPARHLHEAHAGTLSLRHDPRLVRHPPLPPALLGMLFGLRVFGRLSDRRFGMVVNLLLLASGAAMLASGR